MASSTVFGWEAYLATLAVWIIVYFCIFKGIKSSQYAFWVTVPLPIILIFLLVMNGLTLEGSSRGIQMFLKGYDMYGTPPDINEKLKDKKLWMQACGQIFFSLGIGLGTTTAYASYNDVRKPIIGDAMRIVAADILIGFFSGFAVFSMIGYLAHMNSPNAGYTASLGMAYIAFPSALATMPSANFWSLILSLTLFTLGIDSSFSLVEASATAMRDSYLFRKWPVKIIALFLVLIGALVSVLFCFNWGLTLFDVVDNYLNTYLVLLLSILKCMAVGWIYEFKEVCVKGDNYMFSILLLALGYWVGLVVLAISSFFAFEAYHIGEGYGILIFWCWMLCVWVVSLLTSQLSFCEWYSNVAFTGVRKLSRDMSKLSKRAGNAKVGCWEYVFEFWWNFSIKYFIPFALSFLLCDSLRKDAKVAYG